MLESTSKNSVAEYVLSVIPPIIIWESWRSRCNSRYEEERPSIKRYVSLISFNICQLIKKVFSNIYIPVNRESLLKLMEIQLEDTMYTTVKWMRPSHHSMKLITDGSCIEKSSGGGEWCETQMEVALWPLFFPWEMEPTILPFSLS